MEIKIECTCGTKYKFEVEPVNNTMPWKVSCPSCGVDGTGAANSAIQQTFGPPKQIPVAMAVPLSPHPAQALSAAAPPPPPVPVGGLRISAPATHNVPAAPPPPGVAYPQAAPRQFAGAPAAPSKSSGSSGKKWVLIAILAVVLLSVGYKVFRFVRAASRMVSAISDVVKEAAGHKDWNLKADNQVILYVKYTNHNEVAQACVGYWKDKFHRDLKVESEKEDAGDENQYTVYPAHNDYVEFMSGLELTDPEYEGLAQFLSQKFNTTVVEHKDIDFSGEYVFGVYDQGVRKFHAKMTIKHLKGDEKEIVTTEGEDWATANGFSGGADGFKEFSIMDAEAITKHLGMRVGDDSNSPTNYILLKDPNRPKPKTE